MYITLCINMGQMMNHGVVAELKVGKGEVRMFPYRVMFLYRVVRKVHAKQTAYISGRLEDIVKHNRMLEALTIIRVTDVKLDLSRVTCLLESGLHKGYRRRTHRRGYLGPRNLFNPD